MNTNAQTGWTQEQEIYLRTHYADQSISDLVIALGKAQSTIFKKTRELGITKQNRWTEEELKILGEYYLYCPKTCKSYLPNRSTYAIRRMAANVGIALYPIKYHPRKPTNTIQFWTKTEDNLLKKYSQEMTTKDLFARYFKSKPKNKRTYKAMVSRIRYLVLKQEIVTNKFNPFHSVEVDKNDLRALAHYEVFQDNKNHWKNRHLRNNGYYYDDD